MKATEKTVMRLVAVQHLRAAHGIKTKNWNKNKAASCKATASSPTKVFGVSLENLPYYNMECGSVPSFLVDACMMLQAYVDTEGLFRKSGSVVRLKALRAKLDAGEDCLSTALPCDVAGLVKQFFRELPEPVLPTELQDAFLKAQQLPAEEDRTSATMLLSCVLPDRNLSVLRHFFDFLQNVSKRSAENKMDSSNLSVILAPNILHAGDGTEKMNANTEKRLKLQAAILHCFIENAHNFGVLPQFLLEKVPAVMGCEAGAMSPADGLEELDLNSGTKKRPRRSFGVFSSATPVIATPTSKRKLPSEYGPSFGFSNKKLRSVKKTLGIELLPSALFSGASTPGSALSASGVLDSSQTAASPAAKSRRQSSVSARRKSRRLSSRHAVTRVESGRSGCFSPKKEAPRKSLRSRFSLGKSSKEAGSESIGWRLATQESTTSFCFTKETGFSPSVLPRIAEPKSTKYISKSEDNLLTPHCDSRARRAPWSGAAPAGGAPAFGGGSFTDTPAANTRSWSNYKSEPTVAASKPPAPAGGPETFCCASGGGSPGGESGPALLTAKRAFAESLAVPQGPRGAPEDAAGTPAARGQTPGFCLAADEQDVTFGQMELAALSPLHIDSVVFEPGAYGRSPAAAADCSHDDSAAAGGETNEVDCSRLIDALDIQSPAHFQRGVSRGPQSTPCKLGADLAAGLGTPPKSDCEDGGCPAEALSPRSLETEKRRVADHIHHFNELTLHSPPGALAKRLRSPLRFQRTPVRQTVRRMNSLLGEGRRPPRGGGGGGGLAVGPVAKAVSLESGLSPRPAKRPPPVPPRKPSALARGPNAAAAALADVTNKVQPKSKADGPGGALLGGRKPVAVQQVVEKDVSHYRGSPRNPLHQVQLLSATKPVDL
ncbi:rho GTPase-activating protein 11A isoform X2 [Pungitius pungitius]|uniref:rho GTPase-activating protein 11A isoform X2 n=1 Tax=Pungitius pungitius TaxID=134920 RepID=UPI002E15A6B6